MCAQSTTCGLEPFRENVLVKVRCKVEKAEKLIATISQSMGAGASLSTPYPVEYHESIKGNNGYLLLANAQGYISLLLRSH